MAKVFILEAMFFINGSLKFEIIGPASSEEKAHDLLVEEIEEMYYIESSAFRGYSITTYQMDEAGKVEEFRMFGMDGEPMESIPAT